MNCLVVGRGPALAAVAAHLEKELGATCFATDRLRVPSDGMWSPARPDLVVLVPPLDEEVWEELENKPLPCPVIILPPGGASPLGRVAADVLSRAVTQARTCTALTEEADALLQLLEKGFRRASEGIVVADADWNIVWVNEAFTRITGYAPQDVCGRLPFFLDTGWDNHRVFEEAQASLAKYGTWQGKVWFRHRNGETHPRWVTVSAVRDTSGRPSRYVAVCAPIAARDEAPAAVAAASYRDALTGLGNRLQLYDRFSSLAAALPADKELALLYLDLDGFDRVNGAVGYAEGDRVLQAVAARLAEAAGSGGTVARVAADEFALLFPVADTTEAARLGRNLLAQLSRPIFAGQAQLLLTASAGIALFPRDAKDVEELLVAARAAARSAKERGGNTLEFYNEEVHVRETKLFVLEQELWWGLERGEFVLHYQPRFSLKTGRVAGVETLVRWAHPRRGLLLPGEFMQVAEQSGIIVPLGRRILRTACAQAVSWRQSGLPGLPLAVNLSARQFQDEELVATVDAVLAESGYDPRALELEITETTAIENLERSKQVVASLGGMGVRIAIDDFGIGYGSLNYLREFPVQVIKLDRSFVRELPSSRQVAAIVLGVIKLAHSLECTVVAEGVETEEQLAWLRTNGCDEVQGFLFCPPLPADKAGEFLRKNLKTI